MCGRYRLAAASGELVFARLFVKTLIPKGRAFVPTGKKIHFMGAGGIGVSALALLARDAGNTVTACDRCGNAMTKALESAGIAVAIGHDPSHVGDVDLLVHTSAVGKGHPEITAAPAAESRGAFLARLMERRESWGVSGTHGKTTTTWLLASILIAAGRDPTVFVGGVVPDMDGRNYRIGKGPFVAELDESDGSFLLPRLDVAVVTNVESEHLSHYGTDAALFAAFSRFAEAVADGGLLVLGTDNFVCREMYAAHTGKKLSFGLGPEADLSAANVHEGDSGALFDVLRDGKSLGRFALQFSGTHNVQNALAALAAAVGMGVDVECARAALAKARGVERRMERVGNCGGAALYSDYAHHPTEVAAAIAAFRQRHPGETLVVFQPHLYSRTRDYADAFGAALGAADRVLLLDIYPAREQAIPGVDASLLAAGAALRGTRVNGPVPIFKAAEEIGRLARGCEAVVMMGAGDIDALAREIARCNRQET